MGKAFASGKFMFADTDLKFDQPQAQGRLQSRQAALTGVDMSQAGRDLSVLLGGNFVNRFSIRGRSYKVIPQVKRGERLTADQLTARCRSPGPNGKLVPLSTFATLRDLHRAARVEALAAAQRGAHSGSVPARSVARHGAETSGRRGAQDPSARLHARLCRRIAAAAHRGQSLPPTFLLSAILIYLVLAAQFESFRDPFIILAGSVPLALSGSLLFSFLGFTSINIYSQVGLITLVGLVSRNGILIGSSPTICRRPGRTSSSAVLEAAGTRFGPIMMTTAATVDGPPAAGLRARRRGRSTQQHRHHAGDRNDHRHRLHAVCRAVDLRAGGETHRRIEEIMESEPSVDYEPATV